MYIGKFIFEKENASLVGIEQKIIMEKIFQIQTSETRLQSGQTTRMNFMLFNLLDGSIINVLSDTKLISDYICMLKGTLASVNQPCTG